MNEDKQKIREKIVNLSGKDSNVDNYLNEVLCCFDNNCQKSTVILLWAVFLYFVYKKINEFGLKEFAKFCEDKIKFKERLNQLYDLNKIKDKDLLFLCRELGFYDVNIESQLCNLLGLRNNCAHVSQIILTEYQLYSFIEQVSNYTSFLDKLDFKKMPKEFLDNLRSVEDKQKVLDLIKSIENEKLKNYAEQCMNEIIYINNYNEYQKNKGLFIFLSLLIENVEKNEDKVIYFDLIFSRIFDKSILYDDIFIEKLSEYLSFSAIKKHVLDKNYADNIIQLFINSGSYNRATLLSKCLLHFKKELLPNQIKIICEAYLTNNQLAPAFGVNTALKIILGEHKNKISEELINELKKGGL